jgi:hypothetical protein
MLIFAALPIFSLNIFIFFMTYSDLNFSLLLSKIANHNQVLLHVVASTKLSAAANFC